MRKELPEPPEVSFQREEEEVADLRDLVEEVEGEPRHLAGEEEVEARPALVAVAEGEELHLARGEQEVEEEEARASQ